MRSAFPYMRALVHNHPLERMRMTEEELETAHLKWFSVKESRDTGKVNGVQRGGFF